MEGKMSKSERKLFSLGNVFFLIFLLGCIRKFIQIGNNSDLWWWLKSGQVILESAEFLRLMFFLTLQEILNG